MNKTSKKLLWGAGLALLAAGCCSQPPPPKPNPTDVKIAADLVKINERLAKIEKQIKPFRNVNGFESHGADREALAKIVFPAKPDKDSLRKYIKAIMDVSKDQNSFSSNDPQIGMLSQVGEENLHLLLEAKQQMPGNSYYLDQAIVRTAGPKNKAFVIKEFANNHDLVSVIRRNGWGAEVKPILVTGLNCTGQYLPQDWLRTVIELNDPSTYPALVKYMINGMNRNETYRLIKNIPDIHITPADLRAAWQNECFNTQNPWGRLEFALSIAETGDPSILAVLISALPQKQFQYLRPRIIGAITTYTDFSGTPEQIVAQYEKVKDQLYFDSAVQKFKVKPEKKRQ